MIIIIIVSTHNRSAPFQASGVPQHGEEIRPCLRFQRDALLQKTAQPNISAEDSDSDSELDEKSCPAVIRPPFRASSLLTNR